MAEGAGSGGAGQDRHGGNRLKLPSARILRPGLHLLETEVEDFDVRAAVLVGGRRAVVWDTLAHPAQMEGVKAITGRLPLTVVYSHADWDHVWGTGALRGVEEVVAHRVAAHRFHTDVPRELASRRSAQPGVWDGVTLVPPDRTFETRLAVDLGGATLELHALPGHTEDCLVGHVPEWGVFLAGDTVETPLPVVNDGAAVASWVTRLRAWRSLPDIESVVPSHGRLGGLELVDETVAYLEGLTAGAPPPEGPLTPFYDETHRRNVERVRSARPPTR